MNPLIVTATFVSAEGRGAELLDALRGAIGDVHEEDGCLLYALHEAEDSSFVLVEKWESEAHLAAHARGPAVQKLDEAIAPFLDGPAVVVTMRPVPVGGAAGAV